MTIGTVKYQLAETGQRAAILAGSNAASTQWMQIEVSAAILPALKINQDGTAHGDVTRLWSDQYYHDAQPGFDFPPSADDIVARLLVDVERRRTYAAKNAAEAAEKLALKKNARDHFIVAGPVGDEILYSESIMIDYAGEGIELNYGDDIAHHVAAIRVAEKEKLDLENAEKSRVKSAIDAERRAQTDILRAWAAENGSEKLRLMLETGVGDWASVASDEYTDSHAPNIGGMQFFRAAWLQSGDTADRNKPTAPELRALKSLREMCSSPGSVLENPRLLWCKIDAEKDDDGDIITEAENYAILTVDIRVPSRDATTVAIRVFSWSTVGNAATEIV